MSRRPQGIPAYSLHKASGRAVVRLDGVDHYLAIWLRENPRALRTRHR